MRIELHYAEAQRPEAYNRRDRLIDVVWPGRPRRIMDFMIDERLGAGGVLIGRDRGESGAGTHRSWTNLATEKYEDTELSREQLLLEYRDGLWHVSVPESDNPKPGATVQYWASDWKWTLRPGGPAWALEPNAHIGVVIATYRRFYWALFATPAAPGRSGRRPPDTRPGTTPAGRDTKPFGHVATPRALPDGWEWAIRVKFEPFLTWPMGWQPVPVPPRSYAEPPPGMSGRADDPARRFRSASAKSYEEKIGRCLDETKESAVSHGFPAGTPNGIEPALLKWLESNGHLRFELHRCEWRRPESEE